MTEQEIIDYLKNNKKEGRILAFMPDEVKTWCEEHMKELFVWQNHRWYKLDVVYISTNDAVTLSDDYKVKEESKGRWVEFDINKNGDFEICGIANDKNITIIYNWSHWDKPIRDNASKNFINGCCAFGGWQYEGNKRWYLAPAVKLQDDEIWNSYVIEESGEATPAIPTKIRFWREIKNETEKL